MSVEGKILWIDNDPGQIHGFVVALGRAGYDVVLTPSVTQAEQELKRHEFRLIILDVMIPVTAHEEEDHYGGDATDDGHRTGLAFYIRNKDVLARHGGLMVLTVRVDKQIRDEFVAAGLPLQSFVTKLELRDAKAFVAAVRKRQGGRA